MLVRSLFEILFKPTYVLSHRIVVLSDGGMAVLSNLLLGNTHKNRQYIHTGASSLQDHRVKFNLFDFVFPSLTTICFNLTLSILEMRCNPVKPF